MIAPRSGPPTMAEQIASNTIRSTTTPMMGKLAAIPTWRISVVSSTSAQRPMSPKSVVTATTSTVRRSRLGCPLQDLHVVEPREVGEQVDLEELALGGLVADDP